MKRNLKNLPKALLRDLISANTQYLAFKAFDRYQESPVLSRQEQTKLWLEVA